MVLESFVDHVIIDDEMFEKELESVRVEHDYEEDRYVKQENHSP